MLHLIDGKNYKQIAVVNAVSIETIRTHIKHIYAKLNYTLYDDDGHTKNTLQKGNYELINFEGQQKNKIILIQIMPGNKKVLQSRKLVLELPDGFEIKNIKLNGKILSPVNKKIVLNYNGKSMKVEMKVD